MCLKNGCMSLNREGTDNEIRLRKGMFKIALCKNSQANYTFHMEVELSEYDLNTVIRHIV